MKERLMNEIERTEARKVFKDTIPYFNIYLSNSLGYENRPYTTPDPVRVGSFTIHIGPQVYWGLLIHELTHVWQGFNNTFAWAYTIKSLFSQAIHGKAAYKYSLGGKWDDYNVEQQAHIVEDWYLRGCKENDPAFQYIRDNIRKPNSSNQVASGGK